MIAALGACSTGGGGTELAQSGPTVVSAVTNPAKIELNQSWKADRKPTITAEVKDFKSPLKEVRLRFLRAPLEIPMRHLGGTRWQVTLTPEHIQILAVGGETIKYEVNVIAENQAGQIGVSGEPLTLAVKGPENPDQG